MAFEFDVKSTPKGTVTTSDITFNAIDTTTGLASSTLEVHIKGTGLGWTDASDTLAATTVTQLTYATSGTNTQTITLDSTTAGTFVTDFNQFVSDSKTGVGTNFTVVANKFGAFENWNAANAAYTVGGVAASTVDVKVFNGATQTGYYRLVGSSIDQFGQPSVATVSYIEVYSTANVLLGTINPAVVGDTFRFDSLMYGWGMKPDALSMYLARGNDTIVATVDGAIVDGGVGADTITHSGTGLADTISYASAEDHVVVILADPVGGAQSKGTASGGGGDDTLTGFEYIVGSRFGDDDLNGNNLANYLDGGVDKLRDTLAGGAGNDTYYLRDGLASNNTADSVAESAGGGTDLVISDVDRDLEDVSFNVENLTLNNVAGALVAKGNSLANVITGNSFENTIDGRGGADTMVGGAGNDTYTVDTYTVVSGVVTARDTITEAVGGGTDTVKSDTTFALNTGAEIEILRTTNDLGTASINLTGNDFAQTIIGNNGANRLDGGTDAANDTLVGGRGNDVYVLGGGGTDVIQETTVETNGSVLGGVDTIESTASVNLGSYTNIENVTLTGSANVNATGGSAQVGTQANNVLKGNSGANILSGLVGNDTLTGGLGNDTFVWDGKGSDRVTDFGTVVGNADKIDVSALGIMDFESLKAVATTTTAVDGTKTTVLKTMVGGVYQNMTIVGMDFTGVINSGNYTTYFTMDTSTAGTTKNGVDAKSDYLFAGDGNDTVNGYTTLATDAAVTDYLFGEAGNDILDGGKGADKMYGGVGNDTYYFDSAADVAIETATLGNGDTINVSIATYSLATVANQYIENLTTSVATGIVATLTGNDQNNVLTGHAGVDYLNGGKGADTMNGGAGNDFYYVDDALDQITDAAVVGSVDTVRTTVSFTLGAGDDIEVLQAWTGFAYPGGVKTAVTNLTNMDLTGNTLDQTIIGNAGINVINGKAGNDILTGGGGKDYFVFDTTPATATNKDTITDFNAFYDTIRIENSVFTALGAATGTLASNKFYIGTAAHDLDDRIIYNKTTGVLSYDADGSGAGAAIEFAVLKTKPTITVADIVII